MNTIPPAKRRRCPRHKGNGNALRIEVIQPEDQKRFDRLLGKYHYLGETRPVGDFLRQVAILDGQWVGLLAWGSACYALNDRDAYIGWTPTLRAERQKLIVQNRRFLLLGDKGEHPNLASRILGAAVKALPEQWQAYFDYVPLLAETFTDLESFHGTCYKGGDYLLQVKDNQKTVRALAESGMAGLPHHWAGVEIRNHWRKDACLFITLNTTRPTVLRLSALSLSSRSSLVCQ